MCGKVFRASGLILPGSKTTIQTSAGEKFMTWGIHKGAYEPYNVRSERLYEIWSEFSQNRCTFEVKYFFENSHSFGNKEMLQLGGIYDDKDGFAIITIPASPQVMPYHHRMPLVVNADITHFMTSEIIDFSKYTNPTLVIR